MIVQERLQGLPMRIRMEADSHLVSLSIEAFLVAQFHFIYFI